MLNIKKNILLKGYSTFKIGGRTKYFIKVSSFFQARNAVKWAKEKNIPFFVLGGGSNILFSDKRYNGLVIKMENSKIKTAGKDIDVGAGTNLLKLVLFSKDNSLSGLEWAAGIPGTVGGAVFGNAGAFGREIKDVIKKVSVLDISTLKEKTFTKKECDFSYRNSIFKKTEKYIIISASFAFKKGNNQKISEEIKKNIIYRKEHHPLSFPSIGSIFKNKKITKKNKFLFKKFPELKQFKNKREIPAAYLISMQNLKGKKIGGAKISEKHTNFIVNIGSAKAKDVISLINFVKNKTKNKFKIDLETEIILK
mgnify:CR=1 FL=1